VLALAAAGAVDGEAVGFAEACLASALGVDTLRLAPFPDPWYAYDTARGQYSSTLILRDALERRPAKATKLLVLTERDLFIPMLSFVYGQAQLNGAVALMSLARLRQEFYGLPPNRALFLWRVRKEALHEIGHAYGLTHCNEAICTLRLSTNIQQLDVKGGDFCASCAILLRDALAAAHNAARGPDRSGGVT
jgi:archaemetzincin